MSDTGNAPPGGLARADDQRIIELKAQCKRYSTALTLLTDGFKYSTEVCTIARTALGENQGTVASTGFQLTPHEIKVLAEQPDALSALEDWYEVQATEADAMDMAYHVVILDERKAQIRAEIDRLQAERG